MDRIIDYYTPLNSYFPIPEKYLSITVSALSLYIRNQDSKPTLTRTITALTRSHTSLKAVLDATWHQLRQVRNLGPKSQLLLFELLLRVSENPELLEEVNEVIKPSKTEILRTRFEDRNQPSM
ncbi:hypothetical protein AB4Z21_14485, partial [Paenibacillus sp. MCAF20]